MTPTTETPETSQEVAVIVKETTDVVTQANAFVVNDDRSNQEASNIVLRIKNQIKKVSEFFDPMVDGPYQAYKTNYNRRAVVLDPLKEAEEIIKKKSKAWLIEQQRKQEEAERKAAEEARKEEERQRKIKEDQERVWREKEEKAKAEAERLEKEIAKAKNETAKAKAEEAAAKARAEAAKAAAKAEERRLEAESVFVAAKPIEPVFQKASGQSLRDNWKAEVVDLMALVKAVAAGRAPISFLQANMKALNDQASSTKDIRKFDGVRFYNDQVLNQSKAR